MIKFYDIGVSQDSHGVILVKVLFINFLKDCSSSFDIQTILFEEPTPSTPLLVLSSSYLVLLPDPLCQRVVGIGWSFQVTLVDFPESSLLFYRKGMQFHFTIDWH